MKFACLLIFCACIVTTTTAQIDLNSGLVACYSFSGSPDDGSGNDNHGVLHGPQLDTDRFGSPNSAYSFKWGSYISIPQAPFRNNNYTYSVWAAANSLPGDGESDVIFSIGDINSSWHQTVNFANSYGSAGFVGINVGGYNDGFPTTTSVQSGIMPQIGRWYHIVSVRSTTTMKMYVDGVLIGETSTNSTTPHYGSSTAANIGIRCNYYQAFDGRIDDIVIYNRALSEQEVLKLFTDGLPCGPLLPPKVDAPSFCGSGSATLKADNNTVCRWYDAPVAGSLLHEGATFSTGLLGATKTYYVSAIDNNGNESSRRAVTVVIHPVPQLSATIPTVGDVDESQVFTVTASSGTPAYSYSVDFGDGTPAVHSPNNVFTYSYSASGEYDVSVSVTDVNFCTATWVQSIRIFVPPPDLLRGLLACYSFTGNAEDRSGNNNHGTVHGANLTKDRFGTEGRAYTYNGWDDYINIPAQPFVNRNYTYAFWAKAASIPSSGQSGNIFSIGDPSSSWHQTINFSNSYASAGFVGINVGGYNDGEPRTTSVQSGIMPQIDRWYHIVSVRTDTEMRMYVDGALISTTPTGNNPPHYGFPPVANIGIRCNGTQPFHGSIDDAVIYGRPLSEEEILQLYNVGLPCPPSPIVAHGSHCGPASITLFAYGAPTFRWYNDATTSTVLHEGATFTTPLLSESRVYYVSGIYAGSESDRTMVTVTIHPMPVVQCDFPDSVIVNQKNIFRAIASGGEPQYTFKYNFDDNTVVEIPSDSITHVYTAPGVYLAQVTLTDANLCSAECVQEVVVLDEKIFIPNIITPDNGDVLNQLFNLYLDLGERRYILYYGDKPFSMRIYNRWGNEVYNTFNSTTGWTGREVASGTYFYSIALGEEAFKGWVQVVR